MSVGRWIGPGMTVGWHSFTPNVAAPAKPVRVTMKQAGDRVEVVREPIRRRVTRRSKK